MNWIRALVAAGLSLLLPGAGHAVVRDWGRALAFAGLYVLSIALLLPVELLWEATPDATYAEMVEIVDAETSRLALFTISFLVLFAAIDAGSQALGLSDRGRGGEPEGRSCPNCGKPLDEELSFCHWCTTRLESAEDEDVVHP